MNNRSFTPIPYWNGQVIQLYALFDVISMQQDPSTSICIIRSQKHCYLMNYY